MRARVLERADTAFHHLLDPYINAKPLGVHLPGWGLLRLWQNRLCNAYDRSLFGEH